jgi:uroporphyrinogen-III synthase
MTPTLVLTRPELQSREIAEALGEDVPTIVSPILRIVAADPCPDLDGYAGVVLTSANALAFTPALEGVPVWCVGPRTAEAAEARGAVVQQVAPDANELVARFEGTGPLVHLRGAHARGDVAERLSLAGIETDVAVIYRQEPVALTAAAKAALGGADPVIVPLYSPRSARLVGKAASPLGPHVTAIAMSDAVAEAWREATGHGSQVAQAPTGSAMLAMIQAALRG